MIYLSIISWYYYYFENILLGHPTWRKWFSTSFYASEKIRKRLENLDKIILTKWGFPKNKLLYWNAIFKNMTFCTNYKQILHCLITKSYSFFFILGYFPWFSIFFDDRTNPKKPMFSFIIIWCLTSAVGIPHVLFRH